MTEIEANVSRMFLSNEPWDCSNSEANLGPCAARLTWMCATSVAHAHVNWLATDIGSAVAGIRDNAIESGCEREVVEQWTDIECLAYFVQLVAGDLREHLNSDSQDLSECVAQYVREVEASNAGQGEIACHGHYDQDAQTDDVLVWYYLGI